MHLPINDPIGIIHHLENCRLVRRVNWSYGDVSDCSELTAIVQVLILQAEKVPHESSKDFQNGQHRNEKINTNNFLLGENERCNPNESQRCVFNYGKIIVCLCMSIGSYNFRYAKLANLCMKNSPMMNKPFPRVKMYFRLHSYRTIPNPF